MTYHDEFNNAVLGHQYLTKTFKIQKAMKFEINTATLLIGLAVFLLGVFIKPAIYVLRDRAIWWWIKKYLATEKLFDEIRDYARLCASFEYNFQGSRKYLFNEEGTQYSIKINDEEASVTEDQYKDYGERVSTLSNEIITKRMEFSRISNLYNSLVKHYSQDGRNPVNDYLEEEIETQREKIKGTPTVLDKYVAQQSKRLVK